MPFPCGASRVRESDDDIVPRPIYALPVAHSWPTVSGLTLAGDVAHLMSPFAGEGANLVLIDGADLALALIDQFDDIESAVTEYGAGMFPRAAASAAQSAGGVDLLFIPDSPRELVDFFNVIASAA